MTAALLRPAALLALVLTACGPHAAGPARGPSGAAATPLTAPAAACLADAARQGVAAPAWALACDDLPEDRRTAALQAVVMAALDPETRGFGSRMLAPGVMIDAKGVAPGAYLPAEPYRNGGAAGVGVIAGRGVPMVRQRPGGHGLANRPPEGLFDAVAISADVARAPGGLTVTLRAVEGEALRRGGWADASGQAYLRLLDNARLQAEARQGFREPDEDAFRRDGIYFVQPYDPARIPVVLVHGLRSSPGIWRTLTLAILTDPEMNRRFQVWHVFYPTGLPPFYSAARVRRQLRQALALHDPGGTGLPSRRMAMIGHSMGGIVTRALVTDDPAGLLWRTAFRVPPEALAVSDERRRAFRSILDLGHERQIGFAAFINTPHRGARTAAGPVGRLASAIIRLPLSFTGLFQGTAAFAAQVTEAMKSYLIDDYGDSVRTLSPGHPLLAALSGLRPAAGVRVASVVAVRGGPACLRAPACLATDGVVPHASAHLDFGTELLVDGGHDSHSHREAIAFLRAELLAWAARP